MMTLCAREGCTEVLIQPDGVGRKKKFCSQRCKQNCYNQQAREREVRPITDRWNAINITRQPQASTAPAGSWWLDTANFYTKARERFPEAGAAVTDRRKPYLYAADSRA